MSQEEFRYENILRKMRGLIDIKIKVTVRDKECLSMVYTPGVAAPCLEIQKNQIKAYEYTNKSNSILILTDSSNFTTDKVPNPKWNNNAAMPYLEAFSAYYKTVANIDAYPIILDFNLIPDAETLLETVNALSLSYSGVELFGICPERMAKFNELYEKSECKGRYAYVDATKKKEIDEMLKTKKTQITSLTIYSAVWRCVLDTYAKCNLNDLVDNLVDLIKTDILDLNKDNDFFTDFDKLLNATCVYIFKNKLEDRSLEMFNWRRLPLNKEYVLKKYQTFRVYGGKQAWTEDMPEDYYMHQHNVDENSNTFHSRYRGVIEIGVNLILNDIDDLNEYISWENMEKISQIIIENPDEVFELTCKNNYGAIFTDGTSILGLGDIGALAGMPVMEGKSVLFKYFGGTSIAPFCIQTNNNDKFISIVQRASPSFCIINLEDIKGPDCFDIETRLFDLVDCPIFHDDQHGTAIVVLAGLINAIKLRGNKPDEVKIVMNGAGASGIAACRLLKSYGFKNFVVCDKAGAIYKGRKENMNPFKEIIANETNENMEKGALSDVIKGADIVIGLSGPKTITKDNIRSMNAKPIVFALANPIPEIFPSEAYEAGAFIVATGRADFANQLNNSVAFSGLFRGTIESRSPKITLDMKIAAAKAIAGLINNKDLRPDFIMPNVLDIKTAINVAVEVVKVVVEQKLTKKQDINIDKLKEKLRSFFIDEKLTN